MIVDTDKGFNFNVFIIQLEILMKIDKIIRISY